MAIDFAVKFLVPYIALHYVLNTTSFVDQQSVAK